VAGLSKAPKSLSSRNARWFALKSGLRNPIRSREGLKFIQNIEKHMRRPMMPSWYTIWHLESNLVLKIVDSMSNQSPKIFLQDANAYYWSQWPNSWRIPVFSSAPSMQPPCAVDRARVRYLERHLEVSLNLLTIIDILNEIPNRVLQYLRTHFNI
jgi:hypothetical protein